MSSKRLTLGSINQHVVAAKYAVRGELAVRSEQYRAELLQGNPNKLPFSQVISANIGNPQQLGQKPLTFFRQVCSILENPDLLKAEGVLVDQLGYKPDVIARARTLLQYCQSVGAYSASAGVPQIKESVAAFLESGLRFFFLFSLFCVSCSPPAVRTPNDIATGRDGFPADPSHIYLSGGASSGVNTLLNVICAGPDSGIMIPIPQYPLYTATLSILNAQPVPYYLDEAKGWGTDFESIKSAYAAAKARGVDVRCIVIINPGNPTGSSLPEEDIRAVLEFARQEQLVVLADEVYQTNVFVGKFTSFKAILRRLQQEQPGRYDDIELASLHSISKGMVGECGHRGGYFELVGFDAEVEANIYKFISIMLCPPVIGQCLVELMVNPPREGEPSYEQYQAEYGAIYKDLRDRATALHAAFSQMEGVECGEPQGAMYLFPTIKLPVKAAEAAAAEGRTADEFYCMRLLEATGVCVVPGSGFGQRDGSLHFRTTFLAPGIEWVGSIVQFHQGFMEKYR